MMKYLFIFSLFLLPVPRFFAGEIREVRLLSDEQVEITFSSQGHVTKILHAGVRSM